MVSPIVRKPSKLTLSILVVNSLALATLAGGFLYMGRYQDRLIAAELDTLTMQARIFASALGEVAVERQPDVPEEEEDEAYTLSSDLARHMVRRMVETTDIRTRLFQTGGRLLADSRVLVGGQRGVIQIEELPPLPNPNPLRRWGDAVYDYIFDLMPSRVDYPMLYDTPLVLPQPSYDAERALAGEIRRSVWRTHRADGRHELLLSVAVPVQHYKQVLGAVVLSRGGQDIDASLRAVRLDVLRVFAGALSLTVLLSWFLAGTIARPIRRLAQAAEQVRLGHGRDTVIPDLTARGDEIGELSAALRDMTAAQWARMDAIERFAADVAHEIKNPLTSLRSAVETVQRISDPEKRNRLLAIIDEDVRRLDRLITDISNASRMDAELSRADYEAVDLTALLGTLADIHGANPEVRPAPAFEGAGSEQPPAIVTQLPPAGVAVVRGIEGRLTQIFQNLISNALSFSPPGGKVIITANRQSHNVIVTVSDEGPGIPPGKEEAIFDRFYTERPEGEQFGLHSGLGLSIARRVAQTHNGSIVATNRVDAAGKILGATFTVSLPAA